MRRYVSHVPTVYLGHERNEGKEKREREHTSFAVIINAAHSILGKMLNSSFSFGGRLSETSSQSFGWRGKEALDALQAFTAQVRKLRVRTFIVLYLVADRSQAERVSGRCLR